MSTPRPASHNCPTLAVYADPRASTLFLAETAETLLTRYAIERAYVDLSTLAGLTFATALLKAGIPYEELDFGQSHPEDDPSGQEPTQPFRPNRERRPSDAHHLRRKSAGKHSLEIEALGLIDANIVVIPAMVDEKLMDFSQNTVVGQVLNQTESTGRDILLIAPPERGLRPVFTVDKPDRAEATPVRYERQTALVRTETPPPASASDAYPTPA